MNGRHVVGRTGNFKSGTGISLDVARDPERVEGSPVPLFQNTLTGFAQGEPERVFDRLNEVKLCFAADFGGNVGEVFPVLLR